MATTVYKGFSTKNWITNKTFVLTNIELVKHDLLNHIYTIQGERVHMPSFGTRIPLMAFEPNDEHTRAIIEQDLRTVFEYDPRVKLLSLSVLNLPDKNAIIAMADLLYLELNIKDTLQIEVKTQ